MKEIVFITGATSGIGKATAELLAQHGFKLIISGRRMERLQQLAADLSEKYGAEVFILPFDIRNFTEVEKAVEEIPAAFKPVDVLINNAGLAVGLSTIQEGVIDDWERMIDTNVKGLLYVTRLISPQMINRRQGHIINISSIAGKETYPLGNVYCAAKHAVESLTKAMRIEMLPHNIKVSAIAPGAARTEFSEVRFKGDTKRADAVYDGFEPLTAQDIAETILFVVTRPKHVNIDNILVMPTAQAFSRDYNRNV
ncbi:MAG: SDR family NAD(P)-dependent oxidoreductase [Prolixibacteraceae bacterium]|nr:SDR family NAD(P)-dependent oxidoreductase [Prolixibacteraceae bacterium]